MAKQEKFDAQEPGQYSVAFEDRHGDVNQTEPVSYAETDKVRTALEVAGVRVTGVVKNPA
jgi:hypothetical protein